MGPFNEDATKTLSLRKSNIEEQKLKIFFFAETKQKMKNLENGPLSPFCFEEAFFLQNFPGEFPQLKCHRLRPLTLWDQILKSRIALFGW